MWVNNRMSTVLFLYSIKVSYWSLQVRVFGHSENADVSIISSSSSAFIISLKFISPTTTHLRCDNAHFAMSLQLLVFLFTPPLSPGGTGPPCQVKTPPGQRAAGRPTEGQPAGHPGRAQQHRQQLQPERQSHMRLGTATCCPSSSRNTWDGLETTKSWSVASLFTWQRTKYRTLWKP